MRIRFTLSLFLAASLIAVARPVELTNENVTLDFPDEWQVRQQPVALVPTAAVPILNASNATNTGAITVMLCSNAQQISVLNPSFVAGIKNSIASAATNKGNSVQFTSEGAISLNGVPAYVIQNGVTVPGPKLVLCHTYMVAANRKLYLMICQTLDPAQVPALEAVTSTFRFDTPPEIPPVPVLHRRLKLALLVAAVVGALMLAGGIGFYFLRQRS